MNAVLVLLYLILYAAIVAFVPPSVEPFVADYGLVTVFDSAQAVLLCTASTIAYFLLYFCDCGLRFDDREA
jgi:hypothetical protein